MFLVGTHKMSLSIRDELTNIKTLTATTNSHRVSTLFATLDLPKKDNGSSNIWGIQGT